MTTDLAAKPVVVLFFFADALILLYRGELG